MSGNSAIAKGMRKEKLRKARNFAIAAHGEQQYLERITHALSHLAADADQQLNYLESLNLPNFSPRDGKDLRNVDELALEFTDTVGSRIFSEDGPLTDEQRRRLRDVEQKLDRMSLVEELWTADSLKSSAEWQEVRNMAQRFLDIL